LKGLLEPDLSLVSTLLALLIHLDLFLKNVFVSVSFDLL
jgi:hypothetical protein